MGTPNQIKFLEKAYQGKPKRVLEVGSKDYGNTQDFRLWDAEHIGVDIQNGKGVDLVLDLSSTVGPLESATFDLVICCSVLEHCQNPWGMAGNITQLLKPGGHAYLAVPWIHRHHAFPDDYWRFSWSGVKVLFPHLTFPKFIVSTNKVGEFYVAKNGVDDALHQVIDGRKYVHYMEVHGLGQK
jgi:SAM-dependent methyltransferase